MANGIVTTLGSVHRAVLLAVVFLLTITFRQVINKSATSVLMATIVIMAINGLNIHIRGFIYDCVNDQYFNSIFNACRIYHQCDGINHGCYKFSDYFKVGFPLYLLFLTTTLIIVPLIWPFYIINLLILVIMEYPIMRSKIPDLSDYNLKDVKAYYQVPPEEL